MLLKFKMQDLRPLIEHVVLAKSFRMPYGAKKKEAGFLIVKDEGAYVLSNGLPHQPDKKDPTRSRVVYAQGCRPEDGHIGGDDWCEFIPLSTINEMMRDRATEMLVTITPEQMIIEYAYDAVVAPPKQAAAKEKDRGRAKKRG